MLGAGVFGLIDALMNHSLDGGNRALWLTGIGLIVTVWSAANRRRSAGERDVVSAARANEHIPPQGAPNDGSPPPLSGARPVRPEFAEARQRLRQAQAAAVAPLSTKEVAIPFFKPPQTATGGPKIVAIGGGTGMPQLLRGLREYTDAITAIVTVADDGGSSGRLRRQMGMLPPGDFRNNIAALSESEELLTRLFQYRFARYDALRGAQDKSELAGHSFGNLFIATMAAVSGSFETGLAESSRVLAVRGRVLPSTLEQIHLCAEIARRREPDTGDAHNGALDDEEWLLVEGESQIPETGGQIMRVFLKPETPPAYPEAIRAILQADLIVAGPGSFFTSIMPNLLVPGVRDAICASAAPSIYICNITTQPGETDHFTVSDHMLQLRRHAGDAFTTVLANHNYDAATPPSANAQWVTLPDAIIGVEEVSEMFGRFPLNYRLFTGNLVDANKPSHHDPRKLAARLMEVFAGL
ncbi:MAG: YvcK family protein [Caldilineaceae bacterium]